MTTVNRRNFLQSSVAGAAAAAASAPPRIRCPWYRRVCRWGQTNITERDPERYDIAWWRDYWKRTRVQGVIVNAGGIVAYYPSKFPLHHRARVPERARSLRRTRARRRTRTAWPCWRAWTATAPRRISIRRTPTGSRARPTGSRYRAEDKYITCVNSPYYDEYIPSVLREIIERSHPEGFADNSWSGLGRDSICYCDNCARKFRAAAGKPIPARKDWNDTGYRAVDPVELSAAAGNLGPVQSHDERRGRPELPLHRHEQRLDHAARAAPSATSPRSASAPSSCCSTTRRAPTRSGFQQNGDTGKLVHGLLGWDKLMPESMALYQAGRPTFRLASQAGAGIAHVDDRGHRRRHTAVVAPHRRLARGPAHVPHGRARLPLAQGARALPDQPPAGGQRSAWCGRSATPIITAATNAAELVDAPYRGVTQALLRARIPYLPVHADHIERDAGRFSALVLPNVAALSDAQCAAVQRFVANGGGLIATGATQPLRRMGRSAAGFRAGRSVRRACAVAGFRTEAAPLAPTRAHVSAAYPTAAGERHPVLRGFRRDRHPAVRRRAGSDAHRSRA